MNYRQFLRCLAFAAAWGCVQLAVSAADTAPDASPAPQTTPAAERPRVVMIQPVVVCDDDGSPAARTAYPKSLIDQVYSRAGVEFLYLEPTSWANGAARRGEISLDEVVKQGRAAGKIATDRQVVYLVFVSAVDGNNQMLGRGLQNGNVCFVSLGDEAIERDPAKQAFVVAHEIGHCLGLRHAVDDPDVPDDVPNLQGDGPFDQRLAVNALHRTQAATVRSSPLVLDRVECYSAAKARAALTEEAWYPYLTNATPDMLRFTLGLAANGPIPDEPEERLRFAREHHAAMAMDFTDGEREALHAAVARLNREIGPAWPMLSRVPWHFVKAKPGFCRDLPHTRGLFTVLSERAVSRLLSRDATAMEVLCHEKIHVFQRLTPGRFTKLYDQYGYVPLQLAAGEMERLNLLQNPDAPEHDWAVKLADQNALIATSLMRRGNQRLWFQEAYHQLEARPDGSFRIGEKLADLAPMEAWRKRFPVRIGYDHPHEAFAYLCAGSLMPGKAPARPAKNAITELTLDALPGIFAITGE